MPVDIPDDREDTMGKEHPHVPQDPDIRKREDSPDVLAYLGIRQVSAVRRASTSTCDAIERMNTLHGEGAQPRSERPPWGALCRRQRQEGC